MSISKNFIPKKPINIQNDDIFFNIIVQTILHGLTGVKWVSPYGKEIDFKSFEQKLKINMSALHNVTCTGHFVAIWAKSMLQTNVHTADKL